MAKKSGSRSSRSERNAGRKRAEQARQHGLPVRRDPLPRARAATPEPSDDGYGEARSSDAPLSRAPKPAGIPTLVKVVGGALVILIGAYLLSRQRDEGLMETKPAAEPPAAASVAAPPADVGPELLPPAEPSGQAPAPAVAPPTEASESVASVVPPAKPLVMAPVVAAPVVAAPGRPQVDKPSIAPAAAPKAVGGPVAPATVAAPAALTAPRPATPKAAPAAPSVDNPY